MDDSNGWLQTEACGTPGVTSIIEREHFAACVTSGMMQGIREVHAELTVRQCSCNLRVVFDGDSGKIDQVRNARGHLARRCSATDRSTHSNSRITVLGTNKSPDPNKSPARRDWRVSS